MSTVLAQDHFYSDFLGLHVTLLTPKSTRKMTRSCFPLKEGALGLVAPAELMTGEGRSVLTGIACECLFYLTPVRASQSCVRKALVLRIAHELVCEASCVCAIARDSAKYSQKNVSFMLPQLTRSCALGMLFDACGCSLEVRSFLRLCI